MQFKQARFRNWGPFDKLTVNFENGLVGVVGPNGSGKSTLIEAMFSGPTGQFRKYKNLADYVRDQPGGGKSTSGSFEIIFEHGGVNLNIRRTVSVNADKGGKFRGTQNARLIIKSPGNEDEEIKGVKAADLRLREILGSDVSVLGQYAFIKQDSISAIVDSDDSNRTNAIHKLFGLDRYEKIWKMLGDEVKSVPDIQTTDDPSELKREQTHYLSDAAAAVALIERLRSELDAMNADKASRDIAVWESASDIRDSLVSSEASVEEARKTENSYIVQAEASQRELAKLEAEVAVKEGARAEAVAFLEKASEIDNLLARKAQLKMDADNVVADLGKLTVPTPPSTSLWSDTEEKRLNDLSAEYTTSKTFIDRHKNFALGGVTSCPTCGQEIVDLDKQMASHKAKIDAISGDISALRAKRSTWESAKTAYERNSAAYTANKDNLIRCGSSINSEFQKIAKLCPDDASEWSDEVRAQKRTIVSECDALLGARNTAKVHLDGQQRLTAEASKSREAAESARNALRTQMEKMSADLSKLSVERITKCREVVRLASDKRVDIARAEERKSNAEQNASHLNVRIERAEQLLKQVERVKRVRGNLMSARDAFHREQLPMVMARRFVTAIDKQLQRFLALMQSDFTAGMESNDGVYEFKCLFSDTTERHASSLSGGEKVRFSCSFLLAVNEIMAAKFGVLALDEPTAQLDDDNVQHFDSVLSSVRSYARNAGVQIFLVTHCKQLLGSFDQTINLVKGQLENIGNDS